MCNTNNGFQFILKPVVRLYLIGNIQVVLRFQITLKLQFYCMGIILGIIVAFSVCVAVNSLLKLLLLVTDGFVFYSAIF